jgi:hypothetical protein
MTMFLGAKDTFTTAQDMAIVVGRFVRDTWRGLARVIGGGPAADGGAILRTGVRGRPRRPKSATAVAPRRKGKDRAPNFRTSFAAERSRGEMVNTEQEVYRAGAPQDVTSVRAKSQRHRKSTADRWNQ